MAVLKSLTIDGVTKDIHEIYGDTASKSVNVPANSWVTGATITMQGKGTYVIRASASFATGGATGATVRRVLVDATSLDDTTTISRLEFMNANNYGATYVTASSFSLNHNSPTTFAIKINSSQASNGSATYLTVSRIIDMGGGS